MSCTEDLEPREFRQPPQGKKSQLVVNRKCTSLPLRPGEGRGGGVGFGKETDDTFLLQQLRL